MFGRKKKEEILEAIQYQPQVVTEIPTQQFTQQPIQQPTLQPVQERPQFKYIQPTQEQPMQQIQPIPRMQPKKTAGYFKIIGGEIIENGFRYIIVSDVPMKIGDEIEWIE